MASTQPRRRKNAVPERDQEGRVDRQGREGTAVQPESAPQAPASASADERPVPDSTGRRVVSVEREIIVRRPIALSSTYKGVLSIRREVALRLHDDIENFLRALLVKGALDGTSIAEKTLALRAAQLVYDKTLGQSRAAVDEEQGSGVVSVKDRAILEAAEEVQKTTTAPIQRFIEAAQRGIVKRGDEPPPVPPSETN